jgi:hypothetical protein
VVSHKENTIDAAPSMTTRVLRLVFNTVVVLGFTSLMAGAIWLLLNRHLVAAALVCTTSLMTIPFAAQGSWRERILASLVMPFSMAGLVVGVTLYFLLFYFSWFEAIFNSKGSGPFGLIVFAFAFAGGGGFVGYRCVDLAVRVFDRSD